MGDFVGKKELEIQEWWLKFGEISEGPFSIMQLRADSRLTPDTLVWKKGFPTWVPIRNVRELKILFEDSKEQDLPLKELKTAQNQDDELVIDTQKDPYDFLYWLILTAIIICYVLYQIY